jgi:23S rRNA (uracil1939-C5)-methyltransferase
MKKRRSSATDRARARKGAKSAPARPAGPTNVEGGAPSTHASPPAIQLLRIEKPIYGGAFLARIAGKAVFVPLALPGEEVRARIVEDKRGYSTAEAEEILDPSEQRTAPSCPHFGACGGCQYQHARYTAQLAYKQNILRETLERGGVYPPAEPWAYRNRIRLAFDTKGAIGYRGRRSHAIVPIAECPIAAPLLVKTALAASKILRDTSSGLRATEISLFCNADETELLVSVTIASTGKVRVEDFARVLAGEIPALKGVEFLIEHGRGQPPRRVAQWGVNSLDYRVAGFDYRVDQGAFFQVNRWLIDRLVERVTAQTQGSLAWDLFSGVGLFARKLAGRFHRVVAVESAPQSSAALAHNLRGTGATAVIATTLDFLRRGGTGERPDLIVVDPPRTGLGAETTALLAEISAPEIVYVSCDPATLARDLRMLVNARYAIDEVMLADLFPQTFHLETIVRLRR